MGYLQLLHTSGPSTPMVVDLPKMILLYNTIKKSPGKALLISYIVTHNGIDCGI